MNPLQIQSDPQTHHMRIETLNIVPRYCSDEQAMWVFPHRGYLSQDSRLVLPATCVSEEYQFSPYAGVLSLIKTATLRVGDIVVAQLSEANKLYACQMLTHHLERRENVDLPIYGCHTSFETGSGSKWDTNSAESLPGQYRMVASGDYEEQAPSSNNPGSKNLKPNIVSAKIGDAYKLKTFYDNKADEAGTPEFSIPLGVLFPGYFQGGAHMLPLQLINPDDEIAIELVFSNNEGWSGNERAVICPDLQADHTGVMALGMVTAGTAFDADLTNVYAVPDNQGNNPKAIKIKYDTDANGVPTNMSIIQPGAGYDVGENITFTKPGGGGTAMVLAPASIISDHTQAQNFTVLVQGANYQNGDATLVHPVNAACNVACTLVTNAGSVTDVSISEENANIFYAASSETVQYQITQDGSDDDAMCRVNTDVYDVTANNLAGVFAVGDVVENTNNQSRAVVLEVNADSPIVLDILEGDWVVGYTLRKVSDHNVTCDLTAINAAPGAILEDGGLGPAGLQSYDDVEGGKINIYSDKCRLITDLVFFEDNTVENDMKQMMNQGLTQIYSQFVNINSSIDGTDVGDYGTTEKVETTRLIGMSNEVLRGLIIQNYCSGTQENIEFAYNGMAKRNPLMLDYHSRSSLAQDGIQLQVTINSLPRYPSPLRQSQHIFIESSQAFQKPLYLPNAMWNGAYACKQMDDAGQTADSSQPGFSTLDSIFDATSQYEVNDRKSGICNQCFEGIHQQLLLGNGQYTGFNFRKIDGQNYKGNGILVGNAPVEIRYDYQATKNPWYAGKSILNVYGEVERVFVLRNGRVSVTSASI